MLIVCVAAGATACQAADVTLRPVNVATLRDPVDKSYRKMLNGMDLFEQMRGLAPQASLRFKLLPRQPGTNMDGIQLAIEADSLSIPVPVRPDHTFTLERHQKALDEDATVASNRKALSMTWRAEIRTPGLPPNVRRLGDLRLECQVGMEADLVSNDRPAFFFRPEPNPVMRRKGYCDAPRVNYLFFADRPLFGVALVFGARRKILSVDDLYAGLSDNDISKAELAFCDCQVMLDRTYYLPLGDRSWPDDTLVEFDYMDEQQAPPGAAGTVAVGSSRSEVLAALGKAVEIRFDSGYHEWIYRYTDAPPAKDMPLRKRELVVLFAPSGVVTKTRVSSFPAEA
jgi:hypothetical protein